VLGSRSTDILAELGPAPLRVGTRLPAGLQRIGAIGEPVRPGEPLAPLSEGPLLPNANEILVHVVLGPRDDWVTAESVESLLSQSWAVSAESNRTGLRLIGEPLQRSITSELPSEATVPGSVQLPASGLPVLFLRDQPVTGGYPVIAVVVEADLNVLAYARAGDTIRFVQTFADE
jgi:allophanate hydrolase subunit 2